MAAVEQRKDWMGVLAKAPADLLREKFEAADLQCPFGWLRPPEFGTVMVQGRAGGVGAPFNLGEITVTRCALRTEAGAVGHAYIQGRDAKKAEMAAICDALLQGDGADRIRESVIEPLRASAAQRTAETQAKADRTKVDFFTLVRGEG